MITIEPPSKLSNSAVATLSPSGLARFLNRARAAIDLDGEVDVLLTSDAVLKRLNRDFRGKDKPTDVLSFPSPEEIAAHHAGDLAISLETAARQAASFGHTLRDEVRVLMLHGLLHLSGMDHETDEGEMAARETELRRELKLPVTLIERAGGSKDSSPRVKSLRGAKDVPQGLKPRSKQTVYGTAKAVPLIETKARFFAGSEAVPSSKTFSRKRHRS